MLIQSTTQLTMVQVPKRMHPGITALLRALMSLSLSWILIPWQPAFAYEERSTFTGGHLKGTLSIKGMPRAPKRFNLMLYADPYYCGRISDGKGWRFSPMTRPGPDGSLSGAIVFLEDIRRGKPIRPTSPQPVQTKNCVFLPYVGFIRTGEDVRFQNWDPVQHKLAVYLTSRTGGLRLYGQDLPPHPDTRKHDFLLEGAPGIHRAGRDVTYTMEQRGIVLFRCDYHEYMEGWSIVLPHPYVTKTGEHGEFSITDIPPGTYTLAVWHPTGQTTTIIHIRPEHTLTLDMNLP
jgi:plastocyanin